MNKLGYLPMTMLSMDWVDFYLFIFWMGNSVMEIVIDSIEVLMMNRRDSKRAKILRIMQNASDLPIEFYNLGWY